MYTDPYLAAQLARQRHQELIDQAARDRLAARQPSTRRSLAEPALRRLGQLQATLKRWLANATQHEQPAPEG
jgi:hypothetical protein